MLGKPRQIIAALILVIAAIAGLAFAFSRVAHARDPDGRYINAPHSAWFKSQHNSRGEWCCDESDGHRYYGDYAINADGSVTVEGQTIPKEMVLTGPNPTGAAVWWFLPRPDGGKRTYCFAPGGGV